MRQETYFTHLIIVFLLVAIAANLLILDIKVFSLKDVVQVSQMATKATPTPLHTSQVDTSQPCPGSCLNIIEQATKSSPTTIGAVQQLVSAPAKAVGEFFIPLGTGSTNNSSWDDLIATETIIDPSKYGSITEAYVSFALRNPTKNGQVEAQLYNVTDNHPVWGSSVVATDKEQTISSGKITLSAGAKLYRVQLKSTLSFPVYLDGAKIRIITQ